jgi:hypothetical protein
MYSVRCSGAPALNTGRVSPPAERAKSPTGRQRHRPRLLGLIANALFQEVGS